jgi:hypothetical protein
MKQLNHEIKIVETILGQLKKCLAIYYNEGLHEQFRATLADIQKVKAELKRLNAAKRVQGEAAKEQGENDKERSRKTVL